MVYLSKMVIFHGKLLNNQMVYSSSRDCWMIPIQRNATIHQHSTVRTNHMSFCHYTSASWSRTWLSSPPHKGLPQATTDPSLRIAAKAQSVAWICRTLLNWSWTLELSPPASGQPHVTTDPSASSAANAPSVAWSCWTLRSRSWTAELSPATWSVAPRNHWSIWQDRSECFFSSLNLLHILQLVVDFWTVSAL